MSHDYTYVGRELELAANAVNWKSYWSAMAKPYLGERILEVGSGLGANIPYLCGSYQRHYLALEPDPGQGMKIEMRRANGELPAACSVKLGTLSDLEVDEIFDTILYIDVLEHIEDDQGELNLAAQHLSIGGFLVVLAPAHQTLFSALDTALGHYRRYDRSSLMALTPPGLVAEKCIYLDSLGVMASLANRIVLKSDMPSPAQYKLWDRFIVRGSRWLDPILQYRLGKSILLVWRKVQCAPWVPIPAK